MNDMKLQWKRGKAAEGALAAVDGAPPRKRRRIPVKRLIALAVVLAIAGGGGWYFLGGSQNTAAAADSAYTTAQVERRTITSTITGSGTLEAADSYSVTTLLEGTILTADFEEGDQVEEGTVLYTIDDSDAANSLEQAQISLNQSERSYQNTVESLEDLTVTADTAGRIYTLLHPGRGGGGRGDRRAAGGHHPGLGHHGAHGALPCRRRGGLLRGPERHGDHGLHL